MIRILATNCIGFLLYANGYVQAEPDQTTPSSKAYAFSKEMRELCEQEKLNDRLGFEAIKNLHKSMDDDSSGSVDMSEAIEFAREELNITERDRLDKRKKAFHDLDEDFVTLDDLWCRWIYSEEHAWDSQHVVEWLQQSVELPRYTSAFIKNNVTGALLPIISAQSSSFLVEILGVVNQVHRQKIQLKAVDIILFGYRSHKQSYWKDVLLLSLLCIAVAGYWFAASQRAWARNEASRLTAQMDKLKDMEHEFLSLQEKVQEERIKGGSSDKISDSLEEIEQLKNQLLNAEKQWEKRAPALVNLLRKTYDLEIRRIQEQKKASLQEMMEAREMVEKYRKKHHTFLSQVRTVHGADMETIDQRILCLKKKLEETAYAVEECQSRWSQIENLCGFSLVLPTSSGRMALNHVPDTIPSLTSSRSSSSFAGSAMLTSSTAASSTTTSSLPQNHKQIAWQIAKQSSSLSVASSSSNGSRKASVI